MEEFRKIAEFENYSISNLGNVRNDITGRILIPHLNTNGYMALTLVKEKKKYLRYIHRLVAIAFIPNPEGKKQVDHINGNKVDIPSYLCSVNDVISVKESSKDLKVVAEALELLVALPYHLAVALAC